MRLIDADDLIDKWDKLLSKMIPTADGAHPVDFGVIISEITKQPTIEAAPVVHGEWIDDDYVWKCNKCKSWFEVLDIKGDMNFCPNCGAKMDGKVV